MKKIKTFFLCYVALNIIILSNLIINTKNDNDINKVVSLKDNIDSIDKLIVYNHLTDDTYELSDKGLENVLGEFRISMSYPNKAKRSVMNNEVNLKYTIEVYSNNQVLQTLCIYESKEVIYYDGHILSFNYNDSQYLLIIDDRLWSVNIN